eukprot:TRINITY_DN9515_c0_g1_i2.p1 TRINITY_DN9515_c0_g1~~TRINITY_DN9515_c0_g1_i2.p1  ORF type:complete len:202 (+),score=68.09 TRINITY_DN9515_c0_g1_i2:49-654(+)
MDALAGVLDSFQEWVTEHPYLGASFIAVVLVMVLEVYHLIKDALTSSPAPKSPPKPEPLKSLTLAQLRAYNGVKSEQNPDAKIYICVNGKIYDMTSAPDYYGPGGSYHVFAGHDATRALAQTDLSPSALDRPVDDLGPYERSVLGDWVARFDFKYPVVGDVTDAIGILPTQSAAFSSSIARPANGGVPPVPNSAAAKPHQN